MFFSPLKPGCAMFRRSLIAAVFGLMTGASALAAEGLIEITTAEKAYQGRQIIFDTSKCWLADRQGKLEEISLDSVTGFRQINPRFTPISNLELRNQLRQEFGKGFDVQTEGSYVVCGPPGRASVYAKLLNEVQADFANYLRVRRFELKPLEFPLIAVVFPTREQFEQRCQADGVPVADSLRGYYSTRTNQIVFFDQTTEEEAAQALIDKEVARVKAKYGSKPSQGTPAKPAGQVSRRTNSGLDGLSRDTTVHEAIHQLSYNTGLHSRIGKNPVWVVEGLAMQFEIGALDTAAPARSTKRTKGTVNLARLANFDDYRKNRRVDGSLTKLIAGEEPFSNSTVDAYSESWMLTWYLIQTRPVQYTQFLQTLSARGAIAEYSEENRIRDFKAAFGDDLAWFEVEFLRYADNLAVEELPAKMAQEKVH
jgi:hypothetical protein